MGGHACSNLPAQISGSIVILLSTSLLPEHPPRYNIRVVKTTFHPPTLPHIYCTVCTSFKHDPPFPCHGDRTLAKSLSESQSMVLGYTSFFVEFTTSKVSCTFCLLLHWFLPSSELLPCAEGTSFIPAHFFAPGKHAPQGRLSSCSCVSLMARSVPPPPV